MQLFRGTIKIHCFLLTIAAALMLSVGCSTGIGVREVSPEQRRLYGIEDFSGASLNVSTVNFLNNFHLTGDYENDPALLIARIEHLYRDSNDIAAVAALADTALQIGFRYRKNPDVSSRYFLAAAFYSCYYLKELDDTQKIYDENRLWMIRIANQAATALFEHLQTLQLERQHGFELPLPGDNRKVFFQQPVYELPVNPDSIAAFTPCAYYQTKNLTHNSRVFGLGVPLIADLKKDFHDPVGLMQPQLPIGVTLVMDFTPAEDNSKIHCVLRYIYSRTADRVRLKDRLLPLAADFSTPLARAVDVPPEIDFLRRTLNVEEASDFSGLFLFEPYDDKRIPVVFIHGLMSDIRTWGQMLNTLLNDVEVRKKYQFLGFAYSSGNPIFVSARALRSELIGLRQKLVQQNRSTEAFDQMVLVGHSMGGLLCRLQISSCNTRQAAEFIGIKNWKTSVEKLSADELENTEKFVNFTPLPFVKRVVFIAVPHRGSEIARSWIGTLAASLIELPLDLVRINIKIINELIQNGSVSLKSFGSNTGVDNLRPDAPMLQLLNQLPMTPQVPCHSIIGNREQPHTPGGSDGIVPYWSSHLDCAVSEIIVQAGHSAHRVPPAIQEVRQILLRHAAGAKASAKN